MNRMNRALFVLFAALMVAPMAHAGAQAESEGIKDPVERNAYISALNTKDDAQRAAAMEAFVDEYPASVVKSEALDQALAAYQQAGNLAKVGSMALRILDLDPDNIRALAIITALERSGATGGNAQVAASLRGHTKRGLELLPHWQKPEGVSDADFEKLRAEMAQIFYGAAGFSALQAKDYAAAREDYLKSVQIDPGNLQDVYQLSIAELEMVPMDKTGFWYIAKAINLAQAQNNAAAVQAITSYGKDRYHRYHGSDDGWDPMVAAAASQTAPPPDFARSVKPAPTPQELACQAAQQNDPADLSFGDKEFILHYRDAAPCNKEAAVKVWASIQDLEKNGAKLKISVKVISATSTTIRAAISDDNQQANKADLKVVMEKPLVQPPVAGAMIDILGVITSYTPSPFLFIMTQGEMPGDAPSAVPTARPQ